MQLSLLPIRGGRGSHTETAGRGVRVPRGPSRTEQVGGALVHFSPTPEPTRTIDRSSCPPLPQTLRGAALSPAPQMRRRTYAPVTLPPVTLPPVTTTTSSALVTRAPARAEVNPSLSADVTRSSTSASGELCYEPDCHSESSGMGAGKDIQERSIEMLAKLVGIKFPEASAAEASFEERIRTSFYQLIKHYFAILNGLPNALAIVNLKTGVIVFCNKALQAILGNFKKTLYFIRWLNFFVWKTKRKMVFLMIF